MPGMATISAISLPQAADGQVPQLIGRLVPAPVLVGQMGVVLFYQQVQYPGPVMAAHQIHGGVEEGHRVVLLQGADDAHHLLGVDLMGEKADQRLPEG